jgi:hypothetical protein
MPSDQTAEVVVQVHEVLGFTILGLAGLMLIYILIAIAMGCLYCGYPDMGWPVTIARGWRSWPAMTQRAGPSIQLTFELAVQQVSECCL